MQPGSWPTPIVSEAALPPTRTLPAASPGEGSNPRLSIHELPVYQGRAPVGIDAPARPSPFPRERSEWWGGLRVGGADEARELPE